MSENNNVTGVMEEEHQRLKRGYWKHTEAHEGFCLKKKKKDPLFGTCPGGPMVKTPCFHCRGHGFDPQGNYYPICRSAKNKHPLHDSAAEVKGKEVMLH